MCTETQSRNYVEFVGGLEVFAHHAHGIASQPQWGDMDGHHSGYHKAATPPQNPRLFLKLYRIFTHVLPYLYDFPPDPCHTLEERFTQAVRPGIARESPPTHARPPALWGHERRRGACEGTIASTRFSSTWRPLSMKGTKSLAFAIASLWTRRWHETSPSPSTERGMVVA